MKKYLIIWVLLMVVFYLMIAFAKWELNASLWEVEERALYLFFGGLLSASISSLIKELK